jgi:hypothetical protein
MITATAVVGDARDHPERSHEFPIGRREAVGAQHTRLGRRVGGSLAAAQRRPYVLRFSRGASAPPAASARVDVGAPMQTPCLSDILPSGVDHDSASELVTKALPALSKDEHPINHAEDHKGEVAYERLP